MLKGYLLTPLMNNLSLSWHKSWNWHLGYKFDMLSVSSSCRMWWSKFPMRSFSGVSFAQFEGKHLEKCLSTSSLYACWHVRSVCGRNKENNFNFNDLIDVDGHWDYKRSNNCCRGSNSFASIIRINEAKYSRMDQVKFVEDSL